MPTSLNEPPRNLDDLIYMGAGDDKNGDHHIFVTSDKGRAEARHQAMLAEFTNVMANWLQDQWELQGTSGTS